MAYEATLGAKNGAPRQDKLVHEEGGTREAKARPHRTTATAPRVDRNRVLELPPVGTTRWVIRRKAQVVTAVAAGQITLEEVCQRYSISVEEFESWQRSLEQHGVYGLRITRSQIYRTEQKSKSR